MKQEYIRPRCRIIYSRLMVLFAALCLMLPAALPAQKTDRPGLPFAPQAEEGGSLFSDINIGLSAARMQTFAGLGLPQASSVAHRFNWGGGMRFSTSINLLKSVIFAEPCAEVVAMYAPHPLERVTLFPLGSQFRYEIPLSSELFPHVAYPLVGLSYVYGVEDMVFVGTNSQQTTYLNEMDIHGYSMRFGGGLRLSSSSLGWDTGFRFELAYNYVPGYGRWRVHYLHALAAANNGYAPTNVPIRPVYWNYLSFTASIVFETD